MPTERASQGIDLIIVHPNLFVGGAETQIINLITEITKRHRVLLALYDAEGVGLEQILGLRNVDVLDLKRRKRGYIGVCLGLLRLFRMNRQATLYTFLVGQNILGFVLARIAKLRRVVWGNRISFFREGEFGWKGDFAFDIERRLSLWIPLIVSNSWQGEAVQRSRGMRPKASIVIPNGINVDKYAPAPSQRSQFRSEIEANIEDVVIGTICRIVEWKGIEDFIRAAAKLKARHGNLKFVCVGDGEEQLIKSYQTLVTELGVDGRFLWLGIRHDVVAVLNGLDILVSASTSGEGFPNIIGEAMAVGKVVVSTQVGDNSRILGDSGFLVEPGNTEDLVDALHKLVLSSDLRNSMGGKGIQRVRRYYSVSSMVRATEQALFK
jgi:glycosyltransferase involved in cell wall biosynthesis